MSTAAELEFWTKVLRLDGFEVVHHQEEERDQSYHFTVIPTQAVGVCPHCGSASSDVQQRRSREGIKDLPLSHHAVTLEVRVFQYWCGGCQRAFTPRWPSLAEGTHATERWLERAARLIRSSDIANAAAFFGVAEKSLERWYYDYVERQRQKPVEGTQPIAVLGIDELSLKKSTDSSWP